VPAAQAAAGRADRTDADAGGDGDAGRDGAVQRLPRHGRRPLPRLRPQVPQPAGASRTVHAILYDSTVYT
jgi:hypothetical protein